MCLQWCHVHSWLIDNDLPCRGCARSENGQLPAAWSCGSCIHHIERGEQEAICGLTHETLPLSARCCHWNAFRETTPVLRLSSADLAPWLDGGVAEVFDASETAPPISIIDAGQIVVQLDELSVPLVYGVPASDWDKALGWQEQGRIEVPALDEHWQLAIEELIYGLEGDAQALEAALNQLALVSASTPPSPEVRDILAPLLALARAQYGADASLKTALDELEELFQIHVSAS